MHTPRFSIVTPVFRTPPRVLARMLRSVQRQRFADWEHCLVDDASEQADITAKLEAAARGDERVRVHRRPENGGIVAASNDALAMARGEFIVLVDHDDLLHPDALALVEQALRGDPEADYLYTDEDLVTSGGRHFAPFFKPDWSPERMRTQMYTCHLSVLRRELVEEVGGFDARYEGAQDWDLVLKVTERARSVLHVPRVLYHWRALDSSAAGGGEGVKPWAFDAGTRAIQAHCDRIGLAATARHDDTLSGTYHLDPALPEQPRVSIVIPTAFQEREVRYRPTVLVEHCLRSIVESSTYENYEIVCVVDGAPSAAALSNLEEIAGERLRVVPFEGEFNFSAKVNLGAEHSDGDHLLLLNDDIEVATANWIERMVMYSSLADVGAVGGRLLLEDGRLQHVGVRFEGGLPGHPYHGMAEDFKGYGNATNVARNCLAVTGACLMTRRDLFERVGGLDPAFPINYNDVDYCLKLGADGRRVVYDPDLKMTHFESSSRSSEVAEWEREMLLSRWSSHTLPDPYSNPNLDHDMPKLSARLQWARRDRRRPSVPAD